MYGEDLKLLKHGMKKLFHKHVTHEMKAEDDPDVNREYQRQRYFLEKTMDTIQTKLAKDAKVHKKDNLRIVQENVALISEINELRKEVKAMHDPAPAPSIGKAAAAAAAKGKGAAGGSLPRPASASNALGVAMREIELNREQIRALEFQLEALMAAGGQPGIASAGSVGMGT